MINRNTSRKRNFRLKNAATATQKWVFALLITLFTLPQAIAQPLAQYQFAEVASSYAPLDVLTATNGPTGDETVSASIPLGFNFVYAGTVYNSFKISTNGWLNLGGNMTFSSSSNNLSGVNGPMIAPLWDDHDVAAPDGYLLYRVTGAAGSQVLTVEWQNIKWDWLNSTAGTSFQLKLYEGTNVIEFIYGPSNPSNGTASIGLNTATGSVAGAYLSVTPGATVGSSTVSSTVATNNLAAAPPQGRLFRFTPPVGDFNPPVMSNVTITPNSSQCVASARDITVDISDASGAAQVSILYSFDGVTQPLAPMTLFSGTATNGQYGGTIPAPASAGVAVSYAIFAKDVPGNKGSTGVYTESPTGALTLVSGQTYVDGLLSVFAGADQTINNGTAATLTASSSAAQNLRFTEIILFKSGDGAPAVFPSYIPAAAEDFIELTNRSVQPLNISGFKVEIFGTGARSFVFPAGTVVGANKTVLLRVGAGSNLPDSLYFSMGGGDNALFTTSVSGFTLRNAEGKLLDAVGLNGFDINSPTGANVSIAAWSGTITTNFNQAGIWLNGADTNTPTNWILSDDLVNPLTVAALNPNNVTLPLPTFTWAPAASLVSASGQTVTTNTLAATTTFTVTVNDGTCSVTDAVVVSVVAAQQPTADFSATPLTAGVNQAVQFTDLSTNIPASWSWNIPGATYIAGTSASSQNPVVQFANVGVYNAALTVSNSAGSDIETKNNYITVQINYCTPTFSTGTADDDYLEGVQLENIQNNPNGASVGPDFYTLFPDTTSLVISYSYTITLTNGNQYSGTLAAWIDFNHNGTFDAPEFIGEQNVQPGDAASFTFEVPIGSVVGETRLRCMEVFGGSNVDPCGSYTYGETEDYNVTLVAAPPCTVPAVGGTASGPSTGETGLPIVINLTGSTGIIQWQISEDNGVTWTNIIGATQATLNYSYLGTVPNLVSFRARLKSGSCPFAYSNEIGVNITRYCTPIFTTGTGGNDYLNGVELETISNPNNGPSPAPFYIYYANQSATLSTNTYYSIALTNGNSFPATVAAWIDFDDNGAFDANEQLGSLNIPAAAQTSFSFTVPAGASIGQTRLRCMAIYGSTIVADPCGSYTYGETEDYTINIVQAPPCTITVNGGTVSGPSTTESGLVNVFTVSGSVGNINWQKSVDGGTTWINISGQTATTLNFVYQEALPGVVSIRAVASSPGCGAPAISNEVTITADKYCTPQLGSTVDSPYIESVTLSNLSNLNSGPGLAPVYYKYYSADTIQLEQTGVYVLKVVNGSAISTIGAWIDYGNDGYFDDSDFLGGYQNITPGQTTSIQFIVPDSFNITATRMRVMANPDFGQVDVCGGFGEGETEDYAVNIKVAPPCTTPPVGGVASGADTLLINEQGDFTVSGYDGFIIWQFSTDTVNGIWNDIAGANDSIQPLSAGTPTTYFIRAKILKTGCQPVYSTVAVVVVVGPPGDEINNPILIGQYPFTSSGNNADFSNTSLPFASNQASPDVFFQFTAPACLDSVVISLCGSDFDTYVSVLDATGAQIANNDQDFSGACQDPNQSFLVLTQAELTPGSVYYIVVEGYSTLTGNYELVVNQYGGLAINLGQDVTTCQNSVNLSAGSGFPTGTTFNWSNGATTKDISVTQSGNYTVTVNSNGCVASDEVAITINPILVDLGINTSICPDGSVVLDAGNAGATYLWSNGATTQTITVSAGGDYSVKVNKGACVGQDTVSVTVINADNVAITAPDTVKLNQSFNVSATGADGYSWDFGGSTATGASASGTYNTLGTKTITLNVTIGNCSFSKTVNVLVVDPNAVGELAGLDRFELYPNPTNGRVVLSLNWRESQSGEVKVVDMTGKVVFATSLASANVTRQTLELGHLAKGVYALQIATEKGIATKRLVIE